MSFYRDLNENNPTEIPDVTDAQAIVQNVVNLITTRKGTRPFNPEYGANIEDFLFDLMDETAELELFNEIVDAVNNYEPRVTLDLSQSDVTADPDNNTFEINLLFLIEGFEDEGLFEVTAPITQNFV